MTDAQWARLHPLLEPKRRADGRGRPWQDTRQVLNGVLWVLGTGAQWRELPVRYPPYQTCHRRFQQWVREGVLEETQVGSRRRVLGLVADAALARPVAGAIASEVFAFYNDCGECENRIEKFKNGFRADRQSCHCFLANAFRLLLHGIAYNLVNLFRLQLSQPWRSAQIETFSAAAC